MSTSHEEHLLLELMEEDVVMERITYALLMTRRQLLRTSKRKHRYWIHNILKRRVEQGAYNNLVRELGQDPEKFHEYFQ